MKNYNVKFKIIFFCAIFFSSFLAWGNAEAANLYVRDGGEGSNCTSWATADACDQLTTAESRVARGDTIYVASGTYTGGTIDTAASGTSVITIKKATVAEHGDGTGWQDSFATGQAVFTSVLNFYTPYWIFDGASRTTTTTGHGFKCVLAVGSGTRGLHIYNTSDITIRYVEVTSPNLPIIDDCLYNDYCGSAGIYLNGRDSTVENVTLEYNYFHDTAIPMMVINDITDLIVRYNHFARNDSDNSETHPAHSELASISFGTKSNLHFYNNIIEDIEGTAIFAVMNGTILTNMYIYNNLSYDTGTTFHRGTSNGWYTCTNSGTTCTNVYIYNNIIANFQNTPGIDLMGSGTRVNHQVKNNLWFCNAEDCGSAVGSTDAAITYDKNWYSGVTFRAAENGAIDGEGENPFTNVAALDFTPTALATTINAGEDLSSVFNFDITGATRTAPYDIGAYEYGASEDETAPAAPTSLSVS